MNETRKEKLRIANLVDAINERGFADLSLDFGRPGSVAVTVTRWHCNQIIECWYGYTSGGVGLLQDIREELQDIYREALAERQGRVA